ncbi:phage/plasmid primase, P4 family [Streptomyces triticisoli]|uniref:phage/plasmid primase, P4 family n=1 Tax=Streptomyces triticisoli TaxID=2182797 RepID=UPI000DD8433D|nr:phage/plasmid primase, P4 family [Streptomyces triticisoli]
MSTATVRDTPLDGALWLTRHGFAVFPVDHPGLDQCVGIGQGHDPATCTHRGKHPTVAFTRTHASDEHQVHALFRGQLRNVGVAVGACTGPDGAQLLVVDSDRPGALEDAAANLGHQHTPTMRVHTAQGHHDYYWAPADLKLGNSLGTLKDRFDGDVRAGNAYVIGPGSVHATGVIYELEDPEQPPVAAPDWLLTALTTKPAPAPAPAGPAAPIQLDTRQLDAYTRKAVQAECDAIANAADKTQNNTINTAAFNLGTLVGAGALTETEARQALLAAARAGNHPDGRAIPTINSGLTAGIAHPRTPWPPVTRGRNDFAVLLPPQSAPAPAASSWTAPTEPPVALPSPIPAREWDDLGNAERVIDRHGHEIRWLADIERWAYYDRGRWNLKAANTGVWTRVVNTINQLEDEAPNYSSEPVTDAQGKETASQRDQFLAWARKQRMRPKLAAAREVLQAYPAVHTTMDAFDQPEKLLNVANGIVDLTTGQLRAHDRGLYLMQQSPICYDPNATCPTWDKFLTGVMPDLERRAYLARVVGYSLTACTGEQVMFIHHGEGQNGKGVFMRVVMGLLGEYAQAVPASTLMAKHGDGGIPNDIARMVGKRLLSTSETGRNAEGRGKPLDEELVKRLTGEDPVSARFLNAEFFEFKPVGKIHLATNHLPDVSGSHSMARRLQSIGWDVIVPPAKRIQGLAEQILAREAAGVLNWAIRGCLDWQARGLAVPDSVTAKTREHIAQSNPLATWLEEETDEVPDAVTENGQLYGSYKTWAERAGVRRPMSMKAFTIRLQEQGFIQDKDSRTRRAVTRGLALALLGGAQ